MEKMKKLPDAEFDIMKVIWANDPPMTTPVIMERLGKEKEWKIQTVVSLMARLVERGFLRSEKHGKERSYLANEVGLDHIQLKTLAERLNIQSPSLYNHIKGLDG